MNQLILYLDSMYFSGSLYCAKPSRHVVDVIPPCCFYSVLQYYVFSWIYQVPPFSPWIKKQPLFPSDTAGTIYPTTILTITRLFYFHVALSAIQEYFISYCHKQVQKWVTAFANYQPWSPNMAHTPQSPCKDRSFLKSYIQSH